MEWRAPAAAAMADYSFAAAEDLADLPPLWRCDCGFQLDGIVHSSSVAAKFTPPVLTFG